MSSMTFVINDISTGGNNPLVQVTITENAGGTVTFDNVQLVAAGNYRGDLRGLFFDLADESVLDRLFVANASRTVANGAAVAVAETVWVSGNDIIKSAGGSSNNMNGVAAAKPVRPRGAAIPRRLNHRSPSARRQFCGFIFAPGVNDL